MKWQGRRQSTQVEDRRGGSRVIRGGAGLSGGAVLLLIVYVLVTGQDPGQLTQMLEQPAGQGSTTQTTAAPPAQDETTQFVRVVLADTEDTWTQIFSQRGQRYRLPKLVLFDGAVDSACGYTSAAVGPFYCPGDQKVYLDLSFFRELDRRFGAPGDFAQAYVVGHEIGHHVQNLLGISAQVHDRQQSVSEAAGNELSVRLELQADCFAGVWGHLANQQHKLLEPGDVEEGLRAAAAIGDDTLQRRAGRAVSPESWTHGSSAQRHRWLLRGLQSGNIDDCDTFSARDL